MNWILSSLLMLALVGMELAIGGTRLVFSLPFYCLLGVAGLLGIWSRGGWRCSGHCQAAVLCAAGYLLARVLASPVPALVVSDLLTVLGGVTVYLLVSGPAGGSRPARVFFVGMFLLAGFEVFVGLRQFQAGDEWMPFGLLRTGMGARAGGTFISPNHLAGFLEVVAVLGIGLGLWGRGGVLVRGLAGYLGLLGVVGVAVTGSRGGYLALGAGLGSLAVFSLWLVKRRSPERFMEFCCWGMLVVLGLGGGGVLLMRQSAVIRPRLDLLVAQLEKDKLDVRAGNWAAALDQFRLAPLFGTGSGTHLFYGRYFRRLPLQQDPVHAHGDYLEVLAEYGVVGAGLLVGVLVLHFRAGLTALGSGLGAVGVAGVAGGGGRGGPQLAVVVGGLSALVAMAVHSLVDFNLHIPGNALVWSAVLGLLARAANHGEGGRECGQLARWVLGLCGLSLMGMGGRHFGEEWHGERARTALRNGRLREAVESGLKAVAWGGRNPEVHFLLGEAFRIQAERSRVREGAAVFFGKALDRYEAALGLFPQNEHVWVRKAQALDGLGRYEAASEAYEVAMRLDPRLGALYAIYGRHLREGGDVKGAERMEELGRRLGAGDPGMRDFQGVE